MEKIVIEVNNSIAQFWKNSPSGKRTEASKYVNRLLSEILLERSAFSYIDFLNELRTKMKERGLTQKKLDRILNEKQ